MTSCHHPKSMSEKVDKNDSVRTFPPLARRLRELLPNDYELWYEAPFEDKSGIIPHSKLIVVQK